MHATDTEIKALWVLGSLSTLLEVWHYIKSLKGQSFRIGRFQERQDGRLACCWENIQGLCLKLPGFCLKSEAEGEANSVEVSHLDHLVLAKYLPAYGRVSDSSPSSHQHTHWCVTWSRDSDVKKVKFLTKVQFGDLIEI